ncbi:hypothetical protein Back11_25970 [Paenibacillus baekrokdamisoli]|uniref:Uncharacterized protein n=1 Tax=Paenibacillus baekrokdamisoli TaxID=1712516 RepID=A0A3G9ISH8_9BACL|nr:hypothetical protein [Paenibacillus baekrokdamisoli]MBB3070247.1 hypothetical protein [Paenibacillus baekrokdamisoli]BBH21252.1 hypothetical protein Back11_25970 [Paenibacillus baekrokdamisoli]
MSKNKYTVGLLFLFAGAVILLGKLGLFSFIGTNFWPLFLLIPGILLHVLFFGRLLPPFVLVPGAVLTINAFIFFFCMAFGWGSMHYLWPFFILGVALGLYEYHLFEMSRPKYPLTIATLLALVGAAFFAIMIFWGWGLYIIAAGLIGIGVWLVAGRKTRW